MNDVDLSGAHLIERVTAPVAEIVRGITPDQLDAPTPCAEFDVSMLLHHIVYAGPSLVAAARKEIVPLAAATEPEVDEPADARSTVLDFLADVTSAWGEPAAWQGNTSVGGAPEMPAEMVGMILLGEILVHGTDLARATARPLPQWDADVLEFVHMFLVAWTPAARNNGGVYGPEVALPQEPSILDRILCLTGRNPT